MSYLSPVIPSSGMTFSQWQQGGPSSHLEKFISAMLAGTLPPSAAPTVSSNGAGRTIAGPSAAVTVSATGGGQTIANPTTALTVSVGSASTGSLAPGTYYVAAAAVHPNGTTTIGTTVSAQFTQGSGNTPTVTLPSLPTGATSWSLYASNTNGTNTALVLYATGITGTTFVMNSALWNGTTFANGTAPPAANTTAGALPAGTYYAGAAAFHAHGQTTLGISVSTVFTVASGNIPRITLASLPSGALGWIIYLSNTNGSNTALVVYGKSIGSGTTFDLTAANWNGGTFAAGTAPPAINNTVGALPAATYQINFNESNGIGDTPTGGTGTETSFTISANAAPSGAPTGAATTGTGTLAQATTGYYFQKTYVDTFGNETAGVETALIALSATGEITLTFHDTPPDWVVTCNIYATAPNGATGTETLYATGILPTATTYVASVPVPAGGRAVPTAGTSAAQIAQVTFPTLQTGNAARSIFLSPAGGASGSELLYADGITAGTFDLSFAAPTSSYAVKPPIANSTALTYSTGMTLADGTVVTESTTLGYLRYPKTSQAQRVWDEGQQNARNFLRGDPVTFRAALTKKRQVHTYYAVMAALQAEEGAFIDANPGHLVNAQTPITVSKMVRTQP